MALRVGLFLAVFPFALLAANRPPNYDALAELPDSPAFAWYGGDRPAAAAAPDGDGAYVAHVHDTGRGAIIVKYRQRVDGIEVFRSELNVAMTRDRQLIATSGALAPAIARQLAKTAHSKDDAIAVAVGEVEGTAIESHPVWFPFPDHLEPANFVLVDTGDTMYSYVVSANDNRILFRKNLTEYDGPPFTYRVWADPNGVHRPMNGPQGFAGIPHPTGVNDGYQAPFTSPELITLVSGPISTQDPWLTFGVTQTVGNNADAYVDLAAPDGFSGSDFRAATTSPNTFDYSFDLNAAPSFTRTQQMAAITQLFYDVNFFHDWYYDSGFNEAAGNGQQNNYGRGGVAGDPIRAEAQDYSGRNNANMSTPPDGVRPRMQMYIWDGVGARDLKVDSPSTMRGDFSTGAAVFGPTSFDLSGDVTAVSPADGCDTILTPLAGRIAFIDRGNCAFTVKGANAQAAGAIGIIIGNVGSSPSPDSVTTMGCANGALCAPAEVGLPPSLHVALSDANAFRAQLAKGTVRVEMRRDTAVDRDGDLDNEVVAHEWGHYLSNRLIANASGLTAQQSRGMGEGWSDFLALLLVARPEDTAVPSNANFNGTYAAAQYVTSGGGNGPQPNSGYYFAVRRVPYSTDMTRDPLTLRHITKGNAITGAPIRSGADGSNNAEVHATGEVWATMLWECYASLLRDTLGDHPRLTFAEAQQRMKDYIVASLKLTPANPTLLDGRDALLAVAYANDIVDFREFWEAFAKRGAGIHAVAAQRFSTANLGAVEDFTVGANASILSTSLDDSITSCRTNGILDSGEKGVFRITLKNSGNARLGSITATVASADPHLTFDGTLAFPPLEPGATATSSIHATLTGATTIVEPQVSVTISDPALSASEVLLFQPRLNARDGVEQSATDDVETVRSSWTAAAVWNRLELSLRSHVWRALELDAASDSSLVSPTLVVSRGTPLVITFRHRYWFDLAVDANGGAIPIDGGVVEISTDDAKTWQDIGDSIVPGYGDTPIASGNQNPLQGRRAFIGNSPGASSDDIDGSPFTNTTVNLGTAYAGQRVRIRFRVATGSIHASALLLGWQIDDVRVSGITNLPFFALVPDRGLCGTFDTTTALSPAGIATVSSSTNVPDGTVDFLENGAVVASALVVDGVARLQSRELTPGVHTIVASFAGSTNFKPSVSAPVPMNVAPELRRRAAGR